MTNAERRLAAKTFAEAWKGRGDEKQETSLFWIGLLGDVLGVRNPTACIEFEKQVKLSRTSFIDAYLPGTKVLIEQKGRKVDLRKAYEQSDGSRLTPFRQAKRYAEELPYSERPRWIVVCNFREFHIHDLERPKDAPEILLLENLEKESWRLDFLLDAEDAHVRRELEISVKAGTLVGLLYDEFLKQYKNPNDPHALKSLNILCVRIVFCLYAEDAGLFGPHGAFGDYLKRFSARDARRAILDLFRVLNTPENARDPYMDETLAAFPYVNGGLFADDSVEIPNFSERLLDLLLRRASEDFDWSGISPTIFGAVFESTLNPETRRKGGMHYTSIENIRKVIDPLFMDAFRAEFKKILAVPAAKTRARLLFRFQEKLAATTFLDPACGSGNFLTETYISLRRLENEIIRRFVEDEGTSRGVLGISGGNAGFIKVSISQFHGIEINDFAVAVAKTALWLAEAQMLRETETIVHAELDFLPLKSYAGIVEGNALRMNWATLTPEPGSVADAVPADDLFSGIATRVDGSEHHYDYIMGNPPFVGARLMSEGQKSDLLGVFGSKWKNAGNLDYVACWYKKCADLIAGTPVRCALVSTNSVTQGESVANLWKPLFESGVQIDFAYRTFRWNSESTDKAHVHCVIVGFSCRRSSVLPTQNQKFIVDENGNKTVAKNINGYLVDADNVFVESRQHPICDVPEIGIGNKPIDGGSYLFTEEERAEFLKKEPAAEKWMRPWMGSEEFINGKKRWCLWLGECPPGELRKMKECLKRVEAVREFRLASKSAPTQKLADKPTRFHVENMPEGNYIVVPEVSSEKRKYIPIGFLSPDILCSNLVKIIPGATLYHFGVLTSSVHMAWMRAVAGRLKSDYRYSKDIVYNNFPWPKASGAQRAKIEKTAQGILDARAAFPDSSLADLYDEAAMPPELRRAHQANDRAVMQAYGFDPGMSEGEIAAALFKLYETLAGNRA